MTMKINLDKFDLNRLYESISKQIETYNCAYANGAHPKWKNELLAIKEFRDRIGRMLGK